MAPRLTVPPPTFTPTPNGLLSVVQARFDEQDPHWRFGVTYQPLCGNASTTYDACLAVTGTGGPPLPGAKSATASNTARGATPFTVFAEFDCSPAAWDEQAAQLAEQALTRYESAQVERAFWTGVAGGKTVAFPHLAADAEVLDSSAILLQTAATPVTGAVLDIVEGLGRLESALASCLNGAGVIHVPVVLGAALDGWGLLHKDGPRWRTANGNLVALGAGYPGTGPDGTTPTNAAWMYATGPVFAYRSGVETMPPASIVDRSTNTVAGIAERTYVLGWDCCHYAVLISTGGDITGTPQAAT